MAERYVISGTSSMAINLARGLLLACVIMVHCYPVPQQSAFGPDSSPTEIMHFLVNMSVPSFFVISGYLFYLGMTGFDLKVFGAKMRRRVWTLLVPYLLWCTIYGLVRIVKAKYLGYSGDGIVVDGHFSPIGFLKGYWVSKGIYPMAFNMWFVRNLIVFVALSVPLYFIARSTVLTVLAIAAAATVVPMFGMEYFIFGVWAALAGKDCTRLMTFKASVIVFPLTIALLWILAATACYRDWMYVPIACILCTATLPLIRAMVSHPFWQKFNQRYSSSYFFIYAIHGLYATFIAKFIILLMPTENQWIIIGCWLAAFVVNTLLSRLFYVGGVAVWPAAVKVLSGGRS